MFKERAPLYRGAWPGTSAMMWVCPRQTQAGMKKSVTDYLASAPTNKN